MARRMITPEEVDTINTDITNLKSSVETLESKTVNITFNTGSKAAITFNADNTFSIYVENADEDGFTYDFKDDGIYLDDTKITN